MSQPVLRTDLRPRVAVESFLKGYGQGPRRDRIAPIYEAMHAEAERLIAPAALYAEFECAAVARLAQWLTPETQRVVLAVCTLGDRLDARIAELTPDSVADAYILDQITSAQVTALVNQLHGLVRAEAARRGLRAGPAFRPGLGRWPLEAQRVLFERLPAERIAVSLNESLVMHPTKTTSVVIPLRAAA